MTIRVKKNMSVRSSDVYIHDPQKGMNHVHHVS